MSLQRTAGMLALVLLSACSPPAPVVTRLADSPIFPPTEYVEVLESAPARPYREIGVIDAPPEPGALRTQVVAQILQGARQLGADAVILQDLSRTAPTAPRLNPTTGTYDMTGGDLVPAFKGIAIKYR